MLKASHWILIIVTFMLPLFMIYYIDTMTTDAQTTVTNELSKSMTNSLYDTVVRSDMDLQKKEVRSAFYDNLIDNLSALLGYDISEDTKFALAQKIPAIIFCAEDGYYTLYSDINTAARKYVKVNSPRIPYTGVYGGKYEVQFRMSGEVRVTDLITNDFCEGPFDRVYDELNKPAALDFLADKAGYLTELSYIIGNKIGRESENLLAEHIYGKDNINNYNVDVPVNETSKVREITTPCVIAMYQGSTYSSHDSIVNIYTYSSVEIQETIPYVIWTDTDGDKYYHLKNSEHAQTITEHDDAGTLQEVIKEGAGPCYICFH